MYFDDNDVDDDDKDDDDDDDEKDAVWLQLHATLDPSTLLQIRSFRLVLVILMRIS